MNGREDGSLVASRPIHLVFDLFLQVNSNFAVYLHYLGNVCLLFEWISAAALKDLNWSCAINQNVVNYS